MYMAGALRFYTLSGFLFRMLFWGVLTTERLTESIQNDMLIVKHEQQNSKMKHSNIGKGG